MNCFRSDLVNPEKEKVERMIERLKSTKGSELVKTCETLAYEVFLPWLNKQNGMFDTIWSKKKWICPDSISIIYCCFTASPIR
jgi:hypothetical protein